MNHNDNERNTVNVEHALGADHPVAEYIVCAVERDDIDASVDQPMFDRWANDDITNGTMLRWLYPSIDRWYNAMDTAVPQSDREPNGTRRSMATARSDGFPDEPTFVNADTKRSTDLSQIRAHYPGDTVMTSDDIAECRRLATYGGYRDRRKR